MKEYIQRDLFSASLDTYKINKPVRLIEMFAGIGAQYKALSQLTKVESYKIIEWQSTSFQSYNAMHIKDFTDYSKGKTKEELIKEILGVSTNRKEPLTEEQINRKGENWIRQTYNNKIATHNLINIMNVHGKDLEIVDPDKYDYILTYSFPCQAVSTAGKREGLAEGTGTTSSLLWEVGRILKECENKPRILIMENVRGVISKNQKGIDGTPNWDVFQKWLGMLNEMGYTNHYQLINSTQYGIPQNRERIFMVSILGDYDYIFPSSFELKRTIEDMLETGRVADKYYISEKRIHYASSTGTKGYRNNDCRINCEVARPLTTEQDKRAGTTNYVSEKLPMNYDLAKGKIEKIGTYSKSSICGGVIVDSKGVAPTVMENHGNITAIVQPVFNDKALDETLKKNEIQGTMILDTYNKVVHKEVSQTIKTTVASANNTFIVKEKYSEDSIKRIEKNIVKDDQKVVGTITANAMQSPNHQNCHLIVEKEPKLVGGFGEKKSNGGTQWYQQDRVYDGSGIAMAQPASITGGSYNYLIDKDIRKLTPKECYRLMGFQDCDADACIKAGVSDTNIYFQAGDSIVVPCLIAVFYPFFDKEQTHEEIIEDYIRRIKNDN